MLATPLQLAVMTSRIANGGFAVQPRIVRGVGETFIPPPEASDMGISKAGLELVKAGMNAVSNIPGGTAFRSRIKEKGMELAGKTGTAQVRRISKAERESGVLKNKELEWKQRDHALFVAFAPVDNPQYAISLIVEHGGSGSGVAAPIARDIMRRVLERDPAKRLTAAATAPKPAKRGG
jgi:penicillin-binding protein 2